MNTEVDPYQAPEASLNDHTGEAGVASSLERAGRGRRLINFIVDYIVFIVLTTIALILAYAFATPEQSEWLDTAVDAPGYGWLDLIGLFLFMVYYVVMESVFGRTVGKLLTGTRVVTTEGGRVGLGAIIGRTLARYIPFEPFSLLLSSEKLTGWHDSLSGTLVVRNKRAIDS